MLPNFMWVVFFWQQDRGFGDVLYVLNRPTSQEFKNTSNMLAVEKLSIIY